jgi:hypothetical protein
MFTYERLEACAKFERTRRSIWCQWNIAETTDSFWKNRIFQSTSGSGKSCRRRRMRMAHGEDVWI